MRKTLRGLYARANILIRRFSHCTKDMKLVLFQAFCTNLYCTQLWWDYSKDTLRKTRIAFNSSFRLIMGYSRSCSASMMFAENNINNFDTVRRKCIFNFVNRLHLSNNNLIRIIINQHTYTPTPAAIEWVRPCSLAREQHTYTPTPAAIEWGRSLFTGPRATYIYPYPSSYRVGTSLFTGSRTTYIYPYPSSYRVG